MKRELSYVALVGVMVSSFTAAHAQSSARTDRTDGFAQSLSYEDYLEGKDLRASELVGARVRNAEGDAFGEIEELVIPSRGQDDMLVVVSVDGVRDIDDKLVALPYAGLRVSPDGDTFYFDRNEEQLKAAPAFTYETGAETQRSPADARRTVNAARPAAPSAATAAKSANVVLDVFDHRASDLIGAVVIDDRGESVGKVDDIVVSTEDDKLHAVIAVGGFAGFGAKRISFPFDDLQITATDDDPEIRIAMTGEQLEQLIASRPEFRYERQVAQAPSNAPRG